MGIRTPDLLHAISRQAIHPCLSLQVTVPERACQSAEIRTGCCTFPLYESPLLTTGRAVRGRRQSTGIPTLYPPSTPCSSHPADLTLLPMSGPRCQRWARARERVRPASPASSPSAPPPRRWWWCTFHERNNCPPLAASARGQTTARAPWPPRPRAVAETAMRLICSGSDVAIQPEWAWDGLRTGIG